MKNWKRLDVRLVAAVALLLACELRPVTPSGDAAPSGAGVDAGRVDAQSDVSPVVSACSRFAERTFACNESDGTFTLDEWIRYHCSERGGQDQLDKYSAACQQAFLRYWECALKLPDACDEPGSCGGAITAEIGKLCP